MLSLRGLAFLSRPTSEPAAVQYRAFPVSFGEITIWLPVDPCLPLSAPRLGTASDCRSILTLRMRIAALAALAHERGCGSRAAASKAWVSYKCHYQDRQCHKGPAITALFFQAVLCSQGYAKKYQRSLR